MQLDCNTLCECWGSCGANQLCTCASCQALAPDAASDSQFFTIKNAAASSGAASASIIAALGGGGATSGRKLQQTAADVTSQLAGVLSQVDTLRSAQSGITGQLSALQSQVDKANLLAEARAASTTVQDLITGACVYVWVLLGVCLLGLFWGPKAGCEGGQAGLTTYCWAAAD